MELLNNTLVPGIAAPSVQEQTPGTLAGTLSGSVLWVVSGTFEGERHVETVDAATNVVSGSFGITGCSEGVEVPAAAYDPASGLLFVGCGDDRIDGVNPSTGAVTTIYSLPDISNGSSCGGFDPYPAQLASAGAAGYLFAIDVTCYGNGSTPLQALLVIVPTVGTGPTEDVSLGELSDSEAYQGAESLAFDAASGQLYVSVVHLSGEEIQPFVDVVDPASGTIVAKVVQSDCEFTGSDYPDLVYDPALSAVLDAGICGSSKGPSLSEVYELEPSTGGSPAVLSLPGNLSQARWLTTGGAGSGLLYISANVVSGLADHLVLTPSLLVYGASNGTELADLAALSVQQGLAIDAGSEAYFYDGTNSRVVEVPGSAPWTTTSIPLELFPFSVAVDPATNTTFVASGSGCGQDEYLGACTNDSVEVIPLSTHVPTTTFPLPAGEPVGLLFDPESQELDVLTECDYWEESTGLPCVDNATSALTTYTLAGVEVSQTALPFVGYTGTPVEMALDTQTGAVLIAGSLSPDKGALVAVGPGAAFGEVSLPGELDASTVALGYDPGTNTILAQWLAAQGSYQGDVLAEFDGTNLASEATLELGEGVTGWAIAIDPANATAFVSTSSGVDRVDLTGLTVSGTIPACGGAVSLLLDLPRDVLYCLGESLTTLYASTGAVEGNLSLQPPGLSTGYSDGVLAIDPGTSTLAATQSNYGTVVFASTGEANTTYPVTFARSGLPASTPWSVTVGGTTSTGTGPVSVFLPNGTYPYAIAPVPGYNQSSIAPTGTVTVAGEPVAMGTVAYRTVGYPILFDDETPSVGSHFGVEIEQVAGVPYVGPCTGCGTGASVRSFFGTNGTYAYLLSSDAPTERIEGVPSSGEFTVNGGPATLSFTVAVAPSYTLELRAADLPAGASWCASVDQLPAVCSLSNVLAFSGLAPGSYSYRVSSPSGLYARVASGTVAIVHRSATVPVHLRPVTYAVTVAALGLASGTTWALSIDGRHLRGRHAFLQVDLANGTYPYTVAPVAGYAGGGSGSIEVAGRAVAAAVTFVRPLYNVTFSETGLEAGAEWSVTIQGATISSTNTTITFELGNGSYRFALAPTREDGYAHTASPSVVRVRGVPLSVEVRFRPVPGGGSPLSGSVLVLSGRRD